MPHPTRPPEDRDDEDIEEGEEDLTPPQELKLRRRIEDDAEQSAAKIKSLIDELADGWAYPM